MEKMRPPLELSGCGEFKSAMVQSKKYHRPYFLGGPYFQYQFLRRIFWREEKNNGGSEKKKWRETVDLASR